MNSNRCTGEMDSASKAHAAHKETVDGPWLTDPSDSDSSDDESITKEAYLIERNIDILYKVLGKQHGQEDIEREKEWAAWWRTVS